MKTRIVWLLFVAAGVMSMAAAPQQESRRLVLSPEQRLDLAAVAAQKDSFRLDFTVAVPAAQKFQRHRCVLSGNRKFSVKTTPQQSWALQGDTLTVLSEIRLTLQVRADSSKPFVMKFDFVNLDAKPNLRGTALLRISGEQVVKPAAQPSPRPATSTKALPADTASHAAAQVSIKKNEAAHQVQTAAQTPPDSTVKRAQSQPDYHKVADTAGEEEQEQLWVPIAFLLLGIALIALLSIAAKAKTREPAQRVQARVEPMATPLANHVRTASTAIFESAASETTTSSAKESLKPAPQEGVRDLLRQKEAVPVAQAAISSVDLFAEERMPITTSAGLQTALHKLRSITTETQKALAVQSQALEQFSRHTESVRGFLLESPAPHEQTTGKETPAPNAQRNGQGGGSAESKSAEVSLRVLPAEDKDQGFEEVASAIDVLIAASSTKPLTAPASAMLLKIDSLRRINTGLQELAGICRSLALSAPLASIESLGRKVLDLQASCEAWLADQSIKLSIALPRSSPAGAPARREIVESIVNSLYETRKIAVQGPIYFERRVTQLLEYDLPKLRQQFQELENDEMRKVWEGMGV